MLTINNFGIIGGDKRLLYCAEEMKKDGFGVLLCGFENCPDADQKLCRDLKSIMNDADAFILPLPVSRDGITVNAPYASEKIKISELFSGISGRRPVFYGLRGALEPESLSELNSFCYGSREDFAAANAAPTAEGAIELAMRETEFILTGAEILVIGYGRIGRTLSAMLHGIGASVTVAARKASDRELAKGLGMKASPVKPLRQKYDIIFNTAPALVLDKEALAEQTPKTLVIDLASMPGGVDREAAQQMSVRVIHALSLPGKCAPKTAGHIIRNAVYNIIGEEGL